MHQGLEWVYALVPLNYFLQGTSEKSGIFREARTCGAGLTEECNEFNEWR